MKLQSKIWLGASAVIGSIMALDLVIGYRHIAADVNRQLDNDARIVRAMLMATRRVYHQQFMSSGLSVNEKTVGFLPAHALSRISAQFPQWLSSGLSFNNVSDRPRNPGNRADQHELAAMDWFRANPSAKERIAEIRDAQGRSFYHFTAPIWIEPYCLNCHGRREKAPESIQARYADAYDYQVGQLRGVMSIKVPLDEIRANAWERWLDVFWLRAGGYFVLLLLLGALMQRLVVRPLKRLEGVAVRLGNGDMRVRAIAAGNDEVAHLAHSVNDLAESIAKHDSQLHRLNQIYAALSETNQTIIRIEDEAELMRRVCRIAVEFGGMRLAWIGKADAEGKGVVVLESDAREPWCRDYVRQLTIDLAPESPESRGPTAQAWHTGEPQLVQDFTTDPRVRPWRERAHPFGWKSSACFPIRRAGQVALVFNIYHVERNAFDTRMQSLLAEMAMDIGYALDRIDLLAETKRIHAEIAASEAKFRSVLRTSQDGFWLVDRHGMLLEANEAYAAFSGYSVAELVGMHVCDFSALKTREQIEHEIAEFLKRGSGIFESTHRTRSGELNPVEVSVSVASAEEGQLSVFIRDQSQRREAEARIQRLSHFDFLTGLPNRVLFTDRVRQAIAQTTREGQSLALVFIDIDHFKHINDTLGHRVGDQLLVEMAERFTRVLRGGDILSRLGGDEFLLLLPHCDAEHAAHVAKRLIDASEPSLTILGHELHASPSLGIAMYPGDGEDFETLLRKADTATNRAKEDGRKTYRFFAEEMQQRSARTLQLEAALRRAQERGELLLHYQPQVNLRDGSIVGIEALVRWEHPELGLISPLEFIPIAESCGLILPIGEWVLKTALCDLKSLLAESPSAKVVAVNLSAVQFRQQDLPEVVSRILDEHGLAASCLELELTESFTMEKPLAAIEMMDEFHRRGVRLAIDDFGTGYSSLNYLKRFHIDKLKIDQSFIRDLSHDPEGKAIVDAIVKMGSTLKFTTIAEGVETDEQLRYLHACQCEEGQGYLFSRPLPYDDLKAWLREWDPRRVTRR